MDLEKELREWAADESGEEETGALAEGRRRLDPRLRRVARPRAKVGEIETAAGRLLVAESDLGIVTIRFLDTDQNGRALGALRRKFDLTEDRAAAEAIGAEIERHLAGDRSALTHRVDLRMVPSDFQRRALRALRRIPSGAVTTYSALAAAVGAPEAQRAIGNTMATNPVPIYVPCHRVIRSDGRVGNYGGGVGLKLALLRAEGFEVAAGPRLSPRVVLGHRATRIFCRPGCPAARRAGAGRMLIVAHAAEARRMGMRPCRTCRPA